jgi:hypothetical protein
LPSGVAYGGGKDEIKKLIIDYKESKEGCLGRMEMHSKGSNLLNDFQNLAKFLGPLPNLLSL